MLGYRPRGEPCLSDLPGMDDASPRCASAQELLSAVRWLGPDKCSALLRQLQAKLYDATASGPLRAFLLDTETNGIFYSDIIDICVIDVHTGEVGQGCGRHCLPEQVLLRLQLLAWLMPGYCSPLA